MRSRLLNEVEEMHRETKAVLCYVAEVGSRNVGLCLVNASSRCIDDIEYTPQQANRKGDKYCKSHFLPGSPGS